MLAGKFHGGIFSVAIPSSQRTLKVTQNKSTQAFNKCPSPVGLSWLNSLGRGLGGKGICRIDLEAGQSEIKVPGGLLSALGLILMEVVLYVSPHGQVDAEIISGILKTSFSSKVPILPHQWGGNSEST